MLMWLPTRCGGLNLHMCDTTQTAQVLRFCEGFICKVNFFCIRISDEVQVIISYIIIIKTIQSPLSCNWVSTRSQGVVVVCKGFICKVKFCILKG